MNKRFFIVGCQRSGTTLLRLILDSHSKITCLDEVTSYDVLSDKVKMKQVYENNKIKEWMGLKIPRFTEQLNEPILHDFGLTTSMTNFYQHDPIIFIIRDCRDTICSMKNLVGSNNTSWINEWGIPILDYWINNSPTFKTKFNSEIYKMKNSKYPEIVAGALYWKFKNLSYFSYKKLGLPVLKVRYEELVSDPKPIIKNMLSFLDLDWEESVMNHHVLKHSEVDERGFTVGGSNANMPISTFHVGQYKKEFSIEQLDEISSITGDMMKSLDYI